MERTEKGHANLESVTLRDELLDLKKSSFRKYQEVAIGKFTLTSLLKYEVITSFFSWLPGAAGFYFRNRFYRYLFDEVGQGVIFGKNIFIAHPHKIKLGNRVMIGDNCQITAQGQNSRISLGDNVLIGRNAILRTRGGVLSMGENTTIGANCIIASRSKVNLGKNVFVAAYCYLISGDHLLEERDIPLQDQPVVSKGIVVEDNVWLGARVTILDGNTVGRGSIVGAGAVVTKDIPEFCIAVGVPAKVIKKRSNNNCNENI